MFSNIFLEEATKMIKTITLSDYSNFGTSMKMVIDMEKFDDQKSIYNAYLAYLCGNSFVENNVYSQMNNNVNRAIPAFYEYINSVSWEEEDANRGATTLKPTEGYPVILDLRAAGGYVSKQEPALDADDLMINVVFKKPFPSGYSLVFMMGSYSLWNLYKKPSTGEYRIAYTNNSGSANIIKNR